jgi:hypothetical protein
MKYEMMPVVDAEDLREALELRFGPDVMGDEDFMANVLLAMNIIMILVSVIIFLKMKSMKVSRGRMKSVSAFVIA